MTRLANNVRHVAALASLASLIGLAACAHYNPRPVYIAPDDVSAASDSGNVKVGYSHTDPEDDAPVIELSIEPHWGHDGASWSGIAAITVLDETWEELHAKSWEEPPSDKARTVRFSLSTGMDHRTLHVLVDREGAPQQRFDVDVQLDDVQIALAPRVEERSRATWLAVTYPLWGLPRDLVDAPLTGLNRFGLGKIYDGQLFEEPLPPVIGLYGASSVVGLIVGAGWGFHEAGHHYMQAYLYSTGGFIAGGALGFGAVAALDAAWGAIVNPLQVGLLRTGVDGEYVKTTSPRIEIDGEWSEADIRQYDTLLRSHAIFPNWKYVVNERTVSAPTGEDVVPVRTITKLEIVKP